MHYRTAFVTALLGSALAIAALAPAAGATVSREQMKRVLALKGKHPSIVRATNERASPHVNYTVLHDFGATSSDGSGSGANVTLDDAGNLYGTTDFGGSASDGVVFKLAPDGTETLLHTFSGPDGQDPDGAVLMMPNGDLYGTTGSGGASDSGVLFVLHPKGNKYKYAVLHDFDGATEGSSLRGNLIADGLGNLYGTALFGGPGSSGSVFEYSPDGKVTVLHAFNGTDDGEYPEHGVVRDSAGNLYGVTAFGPGIDGNGTVYKIAPDGTFTTLHSFTGGADGGFLYGGLAIDRQGNLYGSTVDGGANNAGTVFKLAPDGTLTTLYNFTGGKDGNGPEGDMLRVGKHLYSTASQGGDPSCNCGVIYEIKPNGGERVLHTFKGGDGGGYSAGLIHNGRTLYGTTASGGANSGGVAFRLSR